MTRRSVPGCFHQLSRWIGAPAPFPGMEGSTPISLLTVLTDSKARPKTFRSSPPHLPGGPWSTTATVCSTLQNQPQFHVQTLDKKYAGILQRSTFVKLLAEVHSLWNLRVQRGRAPCPREHTLGKRLLQRQPGCASQRHPCSGGPRLLGSCRPRSWACKAESEIAAPARTSDTPARRAVPRSILWFRAHKVASPEASALRVCARSRVWPRARVPSPEMRARLPDIPSPAAKRGPEAGRARNGDAARGKRRERGIWPAWSRRGPESAPPAQPRSLQRDSGMFASRRPDLSAPRPTAADTPPPKPRPAPRPLLRAAALRLMRPSEGTERAGAPQEDPLGLAPPRAREARRDRATTAPPPQQSNTQPHFLPPPPAAKLIPRTSGGGVCPAAQAYSLPDPSPINFTPGCLSAGSGLGSNFSAPSPTSGQTPPPRPSAALCGGRAPQAGPPWPAAP